MSLITTAHRRPRVSSFNEMLASMSDLVEVRRDEFDHDLRLRPVVSEHAA